MILISATMHASWNFVLKQAKYKQVFIWWSLVVGIACYLGFLFVNASLPTRIWPYVICSALMETLYYITLTWAYDIGDFSLTYPLARGAAPALLALWAALFLGEFPRPGGLVGLTLLILGLVVVGSGNLWTTLGRAKFSVKGVIAALAAAVCVSIYTAIDGAATRIAAPLPYSLLVLGLTLTLFAPVVIWRYGTQVMLAEWRINWWRIIFVGVTMLSAYIIILYVYSFARISYTGALREVSVVFAALLGWRLLGEKFGAVRTIGSVLIFSGMLVIAVVG